MIRRARATARANGWDHCDRRSGVAEARQDFEILSKSLMLLCTICMAVVHSEISSFEGDEPMFSSPPEP